MLFAIMVAAVSLSASLLAGPADDVDVALRCPVSQGTGRVRCTVETTAKSGASISWADVVVIATPAFATPLRARLAPEDAIDQSAERWRWEFALAARTRGRGDVTVRVRAVVCARGVCNAWHHDVTAPLVVGE